ncbi:Cyclic GMP-AMP synthase [Frankliniella fusca]|uniref:Cyclic GMP-AMP synthase n=1 Tax=Frankliniella fusca TaxID=407009 RepID=A0AAE1HPW7_9NEOP|nr:Cyclic GMP-AMP synthase [Frankliniella fusca]
MNTVTFESLCKEQVLTSNVKHLCFSELRLTDRAIAKQDTDTQQSMRTAFCVKYDCSDEDLL